MLSWDEDGNVTNPLFGDNIHDETFCHVGIIPMTDWASGSVVTISTASNGAWQLNVYVGYGYSSKPEGRLDHLLKPKRIAVINQSLMMPDQEKWQAKFKARKGGITA